MGTLWRLVIAAVLVVQIAAATWYATRKTPEPEGADLHRIHEQLTALTTYATLRDERAQADLAARADVLGKSLAITGKAMAVDLVSRVQLAQQAMLLKRTQAHAGKTAVEAAAKALAAQKKKAGPQPRIINGVKINNPVPMAPEEQAAAKQKKEDDAFGAIEPGPGGFEVGKVSPADEPAGNAGEETHQGPLDLDPMDPLDPRENDERRDGVAEAAPESQVDVPLSMTSVDPTTIVEGKALTESAALTEEAIDSLVTTALGNLAKEGIGVELLELDEPREARVRFANEKVSEMAPNALRFAETLVVPLLPSPKRWTLRLSMTRPQYALTAGPQSRPESSLQLGGGETMLGLYFLRDERVEEQGFARQDIDELLGPILRKLGGWPKAQVTRAGAGVSATMRGSVSPGGTAEWEFITKAVPLSASADRAVAIACWPAPVTVVQWPYQREAWIVAALGLAGLLALSVVSGARAPAAHAKSPRANHPIAWDPQAPMSAVLGAPSMAEDDAERFEHVAGGSPAAAVANSLNTQDTSPRSSGAGQRTGMSVPAQGKKGTDAPAGNGGTSASGATTASKSKAAAAPARKPVVKAARHKNVDIARAAFKDAHSKDADPMHGSQSDVLKSLVKKVRQ